MQQRYQQTPYAQNNIRRYPYPPGYSYYPTRNHPYASQKKPWYPLVMILAGILLIAFSFIHIEKIDPKISRMAAIDPDSEISAVIFCDPCSAISGGETLSSEKKFITDTAKNINNMVNLPGIIQIRMVGSI